MPGETTISETDAKPEWCFTDDDKARLQPLLDKMVARADDGVRCICEISRTTEGRIRILQGYCEALADRLREEILQQVDRGEWAARGINTRAEMSITIGIDAAGAFYEDKKLISLSMLPVWALS